MKVVSVYNIKGGVGKTATAVNLAYLAALDGRRTLLWDLDPQGSASFYFRLRPRIRGGAKTVLERPAKLADSIRGSDFFRLDVLPSDLRYRKLERLVEARDKPRLFLAEVLAHLDDDYDLLVLDSPPGLSRLSEAIYVASDLLLVPTVPTTLSLRTLEMLADFLDRKRYRRLEVLPFFSLADRRKKMHREILERPSAYGYRFLKTAVPYNALVERMGTQRAPVPAFAPRSPAAQAYEALWTEVREKLDA